MEPAESKYRKPLERLRTLELLLSYCGRMPTRVQRISQQEFVGGGNRTWLTICISSRICRSKTYVKLMRHAACLVGNSSSGIREGAYIGTPTVNIGTRQQRRCAGRNVVHVPNQAECIRRGIERQLEHGRYAMEAIYGDGNAGQRIAEILSYKNVSIQKLIAY